MDIKISRTSRQEVLAATVDRYRASAGPEKSRILDELVAITGYHRKHAVRILYGGMAVAEMSAASRGRPRPEQVQLGHQLQNAQMKNSEARKPPPARATPACRDSRALLRVGMPEVLSGYADALSGNSVSGNRPVPNQSGAV